MDAAALIRDARRSAGITQGELAERAGTSQPTIAFYESGRRDPGFATLSRLLAASGARLRLETGRSVVRRPSERELRKRGRQLLEVLELASRLPVRHSTSLDYPRLPR